MLSHTMLISLWMLAAIQVDAAFLPTDLSVGAPAGSMVLFSTPRQPRRMLKKKRRRRREGEMIRPEDSFPCETAESRPLVPSRSKEAGEDYWIDEKDLEEENLRLQAIANRKSMEGEVPKEKLWSEVKAPYKQNWIGIVSVVILSLAVIISQFPELLENPVIPIPDL